MRRFFYYIFILIAVTELSTVMTSCRHSRTVAALVEADSLMWTRPDSSLALVQSVSPDTLDDENRAYHALLLTQAQFRNNIYPDTDTIINRALDFYADNHNRERLTRSLLYKGSVEEICGNEQTALKYFLLAEKNALTTDYINLSQINLRIGYIYDKKFANDSEEINRFEQALRYYTILENKRQMGICEGNIASAYRKINLDSAYVHYKNSLLYLEPNKDSDLYWHTKSQFGRALTIDSKYRDAIETIKECLSHIRGDKNESLYDLCDSYVGLDMIDSALYYFNLTDTIIITPRQKVSRYVSLSNIYGLKGDLRNFKKYKELSEKLADTIIAETHSSEIFQIEPDFRIIDLSKDNIHMSKTINSLFLVLAIILISSLLLIFLMRKRHKQKIADIESLIVNLKLEKDNLNRISSASTKYSEPLISSIKQQVSTLKDLIQLSYIYENNPKVFMEKFKGCILIGKPEKSFWIDLKNYVNQIANGLIDKIHDEYDLNESEINLICMEYLEFTNLQEMLCLGFTNENSITNKKHKILKKLGSQQTLRIYLKSRSL